ncbi:hypothetical protein DFS34DRAFT_624149 [Phlyctochytrium arcticum]|nr:hypothetical protein DFS34DRAFT_624149 [Phlyctochytrium arcticum]
MLPNLFADFSPTATTCTFPTTFTGSSAGAHRPSMRETDETLLQDSLPALIQQCEKLHISEPTLSSAGHRPTSPTLYPTPPEFGSASTSTDNPDSFMFIRSFSPPPEQGQQTPPPRPDLIRKSTAYEIIFLDQKREGGRGSETIAGTKVRSRSADANGRGLVRRITQRPEKVQLQSWLVIPASSPIDDRSHVPIFHLRRNRNRHSPYSQPPRISRERRGGTVINQSSALVSLSAGTPPLSPTSGGVLTVPERLYLRSLARESRSMNIWRAPPSAAATTSISPRIQLAAFEDERGAFSTEGSSSMFDNSSRFTEVVDAPGASTLMQDSELENDRDSREDSQDTSSPLSIISDGGRELGRLFQSSMVLNDSATLSARAMPYIM